MLLKKVQNCNLPQSKALPIKSNCSCRKKFSPSVKEQSKFISNQFRWYILEHYVECKMTEAFWRKRCFCSKSSRKPTIIRYAYDFYHRKFTGYAPNSLEFRILLQITFNRNKIHVIWRLLAYIKVILAPLKNWKSEEL